MDMKGPRDGVAVARKQRLPRFDTKDSIPMDFRSASETISSPISSSSSCPSSSSRAFTWWPFSCPASRRRSSLSASEPESAESAESADSEPEDASPPLRFDMPLTFPRRSCRAKRLLSLGRALIDEPGKGSLDRTLSNSFPGHPRPRVQYCITVAH